MPGYAIRPNGLPPVVVPPSLYQIDGGGLRGRDAGISEALYPHLIAVLVPPPVLCYPRTELDLHRAPGEGIIRCLARPNVGFARAKVTHFIGSELTNGRVV